MSKDHSLERALQLEIEKRQINRILDAVHERRRKRERTRELEEEVRLERLAEEAEELARRREEERERLVKRQRERERKERRERLRRENERARQQRRRKMREAGVIVPTLPPLDVPLEAETAIINSASQKPARSTTAKTSTTTRKGFKAGNKRQGGGGVKDRKVSLDRAFRLDLPSNVRMEALEDDD